MSDWNMYEIEDIHWEEFGRSDDHIVPHRGVEQTHESTGHGDLQKKQQHEVGTVTARAKDEPTTFQKADRTADDSFLVDGKPPLVESSWSHACTTVFPVSSDPRRINEVAGFASQENKTSDSFITGHKTDKDANIFCNVADVEISDVSKMCQFSLDYISPNDKEHQFQQYGKGRENNVLLDYEWDDIDNFENVDRMFRNSDTAFGQGSIGSADELSWFPTSPHTIDGCEDTFNFGIQSSYPELCALNKSSKLSEANMNFLLENDSLTEACDDSASLGYCANANWPDTDTKVAETMLGNETKILSDTENSNGCGISGFSGTDDSDQMRMLNCQYHTAERRKNWPSELKNGFYVHDSGYTQSFERKNGLSSVSFSLQTCPSPLIGHQNPFPRADCFNYSQHYNCHVKMANDHLVQQSPVKKSVSCVKSEIESNISPYKVSVHTSNHGRQRSMVSSVDASSRPPPMTAADIMDKICDKKQSRSPSDVRKTCKNFMHEVASSNQVILQDKSFTSQGEVKGVTEPADMSIECPKFEIDYSTVQENSTITVLSDDISLGSASFRKLQDVLDQLDIRTKLCMRDGLYRLARNAEMRHCIDSIDHNRRGNSNSNGIPRMEESMSSEFIVETGTNPIDRSIAHLLFYRTSSSSTCPINCVSHESHAMNEQNHGSSTNA